MVAGAEAALEDHAQASSGQAQSYRELEAGRLMEEAGFCLFIYFCVLVLVLTYGMIRYFLGWLTFEIPGYTISFCVRIFLSTFKR